MNTYNRKPVVVSLNANGIVEVDVPAVGGYEGFDKLRQYLENEHRAVVKTCIDGPDARKCVLMVAGAPIELVFDDPYGSSITSIGPDLNGIVERIGRDLERRLS